MNLYVLYLLDTNQPIPALDRFMRLPFQAVLRRDVRDYFAWERSEGKTGEWDPEAPKDTSNAILNQVRDTGYSACRPTDIPWTDGR